MLLGAYGAIVQFAPSVYGALYCRRGTRHGAIAGLVGGVAVNFYFQLFAETTVFDLHAGLLGLIVNIVIFVGISLLTRPSAETRERVAEFVDA